MQWLKQWSPSSLDRATPRGAIRPRGAGAGARARALEHSGGRAREGRMAPRAHARAKEKERLGVGEDVGLLFGRARLRAASAGRSGRVRARRSSRFGGGARDRRVELRERIQRVPRGVAVFPAVSGFRTCTGDRKSDREFNT